MVTKFAGAGIIGALASLPAGSSSPEEEVAALAATTADDGATVLSVQGRRKASKRELDVMRQMLEKMGARQTAP